MSEITVNASKSYKILLGEGILDSLGEETAKCLSCKRLLVVSDENVFPLYGEAAIAALKKEGFIVEKIVFPSGESLKSPNNLAILWSFLAERNFGRTDGVVALGGGTVGDLAGFCAGTYMRGIRLVQVPTTLLAIIDSSVGGKTAVNLKEGKNLAGVFYQPDLVFSDLNFLKTLPKEQLMSGKGELLKYALLRGGLLYDSVENGGFEENLLSVVEDCIICKKEIVEADETEGGKRKLLNLGHTLGHAIEKVTNFAVPHGVAVAMGIEYMVKVAYRREELSKEDYVGIMRLLTKFGVSGSFIDLDMLIEFIKKDKKIQGDFITLVTVRGIGDCRLTKVSLDELRGYLKC